MFIHILTGGGKFIFWFLLFCNLLISEEFETLDDIIQKAAKRLFEKPYKEEFSFLSNFKEKHFEIVDIRNYCNGNFSKWVGTHNLKYIETGEKKYYGVPFKILSEEESQNTCIMTKSELLDGHLNFNIPVNKKVYAVYFLIANYYASPEEKGERRFIFKYEDGTMENLELIYGINMFDWFPQERSETDDLKYVLVRTSPNFSPPYRNLYVLQWKNPYPEKPIKDIEFYSDGKGMRATIIIGITLLLK